MYFYNEEQESTRNRESRLSQREMVDSYSPRTEE